MVFIQVFKNNKAPGTNIKYKKEVNYSYLQTNGTQMILDAESRKEICQYDEFNILFLYNFYLYLRKNAILKFYI